MSRRSQISRLVTVFVTYRLPLKHSHGFSHDMMSADVGNRLSTARKRIARNDHRPDLRPVRRHSSSRCPLGEMLNNARMARSTNVRKCTAAVIEERRPPDRASLMQD